MIYARGVPLPPRGSPEDRIQREMVWRERTEKVVFLQSVGSMIGAIFNLNADKVFNGIYRKYAQEVFQETYNAELLARRAAELRRAQGTIRGKRLHDLNMIKRLNAMGDWADREYGMDLKPLPRVKKPKEKKK